MKTWIHQGDLKARKGVVYDYTEITGALDARGADTKTAFPKLTTVARIITETAGQYGHAAFVAFIAGAEEAA